MIDIDVREIAAWQEKLHEAAEKLRALPDAELLALVTSGVRPVAATGAPRRSELGSEKRTPRRAVSKKTIDDVAKKHAVPKAKKAAAPARANPPTDAELEERRARIVETLRGREWTSPKEIGDELGLPRHVISTDLRALLRDKAVEHNGEESKLGRYRVPAARGRQTGAKPARKAAPASDDEEGATVQVAPLPVIASAAIHRSPTSLLSTPLPPAARPWPFGRRALDVRPEPPVAEIVARSHPIADELPPLPKGAGLEEGSGDRRADCRHALECLTRFCKAHLGGFDVPGRCPSGCAHYAPPARDALIDLAMTGGRSALASAIEAESSCKRPN